MPQGPYYLAYLVFLLIPGFVTLRAFHFSHISLDTYSRLNKLAIVALGGFSSLVIVTVLYRINLHSFLITAISDVFGCVWSLRSLVVEVPSDLTCTPGFPKYSLNEKVTYESVNELSLLGSSGIIFVQSAIGVSLGYWYGLFKRKVDGNNSQSREKLAQPWEHAYAISDTGDKVTIITTQNREIKGTIQQIGSPSKDNDLLLADPAEIIRNPSDEVVRDRDIGEYSYHHYRDIARIEFNPENEYDPDGHTEGDRFFRQQLNSWYRAFWKVPPASDVMNRWKNSRWSDQNEGDSPRTEPTELDVEED